jgi:deazaflavin-dependent oxidoreductase (nitroreductase family)
MTDIKIPASLPDWISEHVRLYREDPVRGRLWDSTDVGGPGVLPCLLLMTRGRRSGKTSTLPLIYGEHGDAFVIVASKGGAPSHPAWYLNLVDCPDCEIQVGPDHYRARARTADGEERESLWRMMAEIYPPYEDYQVVAGERMIPVVVLDRVE